jgi:hypothetical protein
MNPGPRGSGLDAPQFEGLRADVHAGVSARKAMKPAALSVVKSLNLNRVQSEMRNFQFVFSVGGFLDLGETRFRI